MCIERRWKNSVKLFRYYVSIYLYKGEVAKNARKTHTLTSSFLFFLCFVEFWLACEERVLCTIPSKLIECLAPGDA